MPTIHDTPEFVFSNSPARERREPKAPHVMIVFNTPYLYGMERYVIELFDFLRPEVEPFFLMSYTTHRFDLPVLQEVKRRQLPHAFFSDQQEWPMLGKPRSSKHAWHLLKAFVRGNLDVLHHSSRSDVLYVSSVNYLSYAVLTAAWFRLTGRRVLYTFHDLLDRPSRRLRLLSALLTDYVHYVDYGYQYVLRTNPYVATKPNFVCPGRTQDFRPVDVGSAVREAFAGGRNILFYGRVSPEKGIDLLLEAFSRITPKFPDVKLQIAGGCKDEEQLQRAISELGLSGRVHYWGYLENIFPLLTMSYVYVQPSVPSRVRESFGRGAVEAMSQSVPVVCFKSGALQEVVIHEKTGLVCDEESADALAAALERFLRDNVFRDRCGAAGRIRYEENYSDGAIRSRWLDFFRR
jgi:glycosyltransferase involved in cell wall biosynthesis